jgi:hypothetical protein
VRIAKVLIVGWLTALPSGAAELCLVPSSNGLNVTTKCGGAVATNYWSGFSSQSTPCGLVSTDLCVADPPPLYHASWTISGSSTSPYSNTGPIGPGPTDLFLWLLCAEPAGMESAEFGLGGDLNVVSFTAMNSFVNAGTATDLRIEVLGCPYGPLVVGAITVDSPVSVTSSTWGRMKGAYR